MKAPRPWRRCTDPRELRAGRLDLVVEGGRRRHQRQRVDESPARFAQEGFYIQIHTEKAPEGNLWGWLLPTKMTRTIVALLAGWIVVVAAVSGRTCGRVASPPPSALHRQTSRRARWSISTASPVWPANQGGGAGPRHGDLTSRGERRNLGESDSQGARRHDAPSGCRAGRTRLRRTRRLAGR